ncbi:MAG: hypothetical protein GJ680_18550 [Alteromonadaceae bacterium]|nr:hypothetical protein [Alteromonadaceae bacterium]
MKNDNRNYLTWLRDVFAKPSSAAKYLVSIVFGGILISWILFGKEPTFTGMLGSCFVGIVTAFLGMFLNRRFPAQVKEK